MDRITAEILESITDACTVLDRDWRFLYVNTKAAQLLGKSRDQLIGRVVWEVFPEEVGGEPYNKLQQAMAQRVPLHFDVYSPGFNGWFQNSVYPTGEGLSIYWQDIAERKRAEEKLRRSEAYLAEGQRISHTGSWAWNVASGDVFWSLEHFRICGLKPGEFKPTISTAPRIIHPDDLAAAQEAWLGATRQAKDFDHQFRVLRPGGTIRHVRSLGHPVFGTAGQLTEYVGTIMDITGQKEAQDALNEARAELAHVNRALTMGELTASIAHELNQPLAAIAANAAASERWLGAPAPNLDEIHQCLRRISRDAMRASDVVARIRAVLARRPPQKTELRIDEVIRDVSLLVQREAQAKNVQMQVTADEVLPAIVADRVQLQQVVLNLVINAIEAMGAAEPRRLEIRAEPNGADGVLVGVRDSGAGVDPRTAERIFDAFFTTKADGMGMGLAISRSIVEAHGGRLWATNNEGGGATFRFTLPAQAAGSTEFHDRRETLL